MDKPVVLCEYSSRSTPNKKYHIIKAKDNSIYCDCWQWKRTRNCAHLEDFNTNIVPKYQQGVRLANLDNDSELLVAIDKAISDLK